MLQTKKHRPYIKSLYLINNCIGDNYLKRVASNKINYILGSNTLSITWITPLD